MHHRRDLLLVGTHRDAMGVGEEHEAQRSRALEELNLQLCQRLAYFEAFARLRMPSAARAHGRVFFAVGDDPWAVGDELGSLRRALCKAVARNGALRRSRPEMWLRFLEEVRCVPCSDAVGPQSYRHALSREQCRQVADRLAYEYTNRAMQPEAFTLMLRLLQEMGEIMVVDVGDGEGVVLPRREYPFHLYRKVQWVDRPL